MNICPFNSDSDRIDSEYNPEIQLQLITGKKERKKGTMILQETGTTDILNTQTHDPNKQNQN